MTESSQGAAELQEIRDALIQLGAIINAHAPQLRRLELDMQQLNITVRELGARPPPVPSTSDPSSGAESSAHAAPAQPPVDPTITIPLSAPQPFSGEPRTCRGFMLQCSQIFLHQARLFPTEPARVGYIISRLSGSALEWAAAVMDSQLPEANDSQLFLHRLGLMFDTGRVTPANVIMPTNVIHHKRNKNMQLLM